MCYIRYHEFEFTSFEMLDGGSIQEVNWILMVSFPLGQGVGTFANLDTPQEAENMGFAWAGTVDIG